MRAYVRQLTFVFLFVFISLLCLVFSSFQKDQNLVVDFLDVGQGDAIYIKSPNGKSMLIDGGPKGSLSAALKKVQKDDRIDVFVLTNPDTDHFAGLLDIIDDYSIGAVVESGTISTTKTYQAFSKYVSDKKIQRVIAQKGMKIILDDKKNIYFEVLFPDRVVSGWSRNDGSIVGKLVYDKKSFMFTGDATTKTESIVSFRNSKDVLESDVLKIGHHGSKTSTSQLWLDAVTPEYAVVSYGFANRYGHPHSLTVDKILSRNITLLETAKDGTIVCITNGLELDCNGEL